MSLIDKLLEHGPHGKGPGLDRLLNTQRLEQALDLIKNDPALPFNDALQRTDADLSNLPTSVLRDIVQSQPPEVQQQVAQWASSGELPGGAHRLGLGDAPTPTPGPHNLPGPGGAPPGPGNALPGPGNTPATVLANLANNVAPTFNPAPHATPGAPQGGIRPDAAPGEMIQRLFEGRVDGNQSLAAMRTPGGENLRTHAAQSVVMPRGENAVRQDALQQPGHLLRARGDGPLPGQAPANAAANAQPQGTTRAPGLTGAQQALAQNVPLTQGRPDAQQPGQQQALLRGDAALPSQAALPQQAVPATQARPDALAPQLLQAQGQTQLATPAQARPEGTTVPLAPQLAGVTVMANPQAPAFNPQSTQPPQLAGIAQNAAAQGREPLLAPAGHTLAGFLRRDQRGRQALRQKPIDWALALLPGVHKRAAGSEAKSISFQWLFWLLTIIAYGSLAIAVIAMVPNGGRLLDADGVPTPGVYALLIGGIAALASWLVARRLTKRE